MASICLFCSSQVSPHSHQSDDKLQKEQIFQLISSALFVEEEVMKCWNFQTEALPFCSACHDKVHSYSTLCHQLISLQLEISIVLEDCKNIIRNSAHRKCGTGMQTRGAAATAVISSSQRFDNFRQQAVSSAENRRICSERLENITGLHMYRNDSAASIISEDDLSVTFEDMNDECDEKNELQMGGQEYTFNYDLRPIPSSNDIFINEILKDAEDLNRVAEVPRWSKSSDRYGYVEVSLPTNSSKLWKCGAEECSFQFEHGTKTHPKRAMSRHILKTHYPSKTCPTCGIGFETALAMQSHNCQALRPMEKSRTKQCKKCSVVFENLSKLRIHKCSATATLQKTGVSRRQSSDSEAEESNSSSSLNNEPSIIFQCDVCFKKLSSKATLQRHVETHTKTSEERKNSICERCGTAYSAWQLTRHLREVHGEGTPLANFPCTVPNCNKSFPHMTKLKRHQKCHETRPQTNNQSLTINTYEEVQIISHLK